MTPRDRLVVQTGRCRSPTAERVMSGAQGEEAAARQRRRHAARVSSRPRIWSSTGGMPFATRDAQGRLRVGAAVGATGDYLERAAEVIAPARTCWSSTSRTAIRWSWSARSSRSGEQRAGVDVIAGNVATADGATFLLERGVNGDQGRHRSRRRLLDATDDELRHAAGRGARAVPPGRRRPGAAHRRRRDPARWTRGRSAALRRRLR